MPVPAVHFPASETATLSNGLKLILVPRPGVPLVTLSLQLDAGYAADQFAQPGTARLAMAALTSGTTHRDALGISSELLSLGAGLHAASTLDSTSVALVGAQVETGPIFGLVRRCDPQSHVPGSRCTQAA